MKSQETGVGSTEVLLCGASVTSAPSDARGKVLLRTPRFPKIRLSWTVSSNASSGVKVNIRPGITEHNIL